METEFLEQDFSLENRSSAVKLSYGWQSFYAFFLNQGIIMVGNTILVVICHWGTF